MTKLKPLLVLLMLSNVTLADDSAPIAANTLHPEDLAGTWSGQRKLDDGGSITVLVKFRGSDRAMDPDSVWFHESAPRLGITGQMKLIDDDKPNSVAIQYNFIEGKTNKAGSAIIGTASLNALFQHAAGRCHTKSRRVRSHKRETSPIGGRTVVASISS